MPLEHDPRAAAEIGDLLGLVGLRSGGGGAGMDASDAGAAARRLRRLIAGEIEGRRAVLGHADGRERTYWFYAYRDPPGLVMVVGCPRRGLPGGRTKHLLHAAFPGEVFAGARTLAARLESLAEAQASLGLDAGEAAAGG